MTKMPENNYYVTHHNITDVEIKGRRTEADRYDDEYSRSDAEERIVELVREAVAGRLFAEIVISVSGNQGHVIRFGQVGDETTPVLDEG